MEESAKANPKLDYSIPESKDTPLALVPPSDFNIRRCRQLALFPQVTGLLILVAYAITRLPIFPIIGALWVMIGGAMTIIPIVISSEMLLRSYRTRHLPGGHLQRMFWVTILAIMNIPMATFCIYAGRWLIDLTNAKSG